VVKSPDQQLADQENRSPLRKSRHPGAVQRSQSFQNARNSTAGKHPSVDAVSMENLISSDAPLRNPSFRIATQISPIRFESPDASIRESPERALNSVAPGSVKGVLVDNKNVDNLHPYVRKSIDNIDCPDGGRKLTVGQDDVFLGTTDSLDSSYLEDGSLRKRGRYVSMPSLLGEHPASPKISRLNSERLPGSPYQKLPVHHARKIDIKPYFVTVANESNENTGNRLAKDHRQINAFNDTFSSLRKSQENLLDKNTSKHLTLTQPKPFTLLSKPSVIGAGSQAKLNKWGPEKFTKGSMSDLSHENDDPWVPNKPRSYTESRVTLQGSRRAQVPSSLASNQLSPHTVAKRHERTRSFGGHEINADNSSDNFDWIVYANRNSIPLSTFTAEEMSKKYKYHPTSPHGFKDSVQATSATSQSSPVKAGVTSHSTPVRRPSYHYNRFTDATVTSGDSSISLSATTSSDTCSSPDVLKDMSDTSPGLERFFPRDRTQVSRSFSTPSTKSGERHEERPASADMLDEVSTLADSDRLLAEMEHYMKKSTSSSGSQSSNHNRFPEAIPNFEEREKVGRNRKQNRDSCVSTGSASSYDSTEELSSDPHSEEGLVDSIKSKISNLASRFTGRRLHQSDSNSSNLSTSPPTNKHKPDASRISHNFSLRLKGGQPKSGEPDLPSLLREMEPGSEAIGSRMANTDLDDYATFSVKHDDAGTENKKPASHRQMRKIHYGRFSTSDLIARHNMPGAMKFQSESRLCSANVPPITVEQADSAYSIQSADVDGSSSDDSPRNDYRVDADEAVPKADTSDTYYEQRLLEALNADEAFRDSAVYCDEVEGTQSCPHDQCQPVSAKMSIRNVVHQFEERQRQKALSPVRVKSREPSSTIKQRMEILAANATYRPKSAGASRSISQSTSRSHSRSSSRAGSEEKTLSRASVDLQEYIERRFPSARMSAVTDNDNTSGFRGRVSSTGGVLKSSYSTSRLDILRSDVDNLMFNKGWVRELIQKFQQQHNK